MRPLLTTVTVVALVVGGVAGTAGTAHAQSSTSDLRAQVDSIGARYLAAQEQAHTLDLQLQALDQRLAQSRRKTDALLPQAKARAIQLYQEGSQGFTALFDSANAIETARRAELLARAGEHSQALIDEYTSASANLQLQRGQVAAARNKQAHVVASLATQERALERALAAAQQRYRDAQAAQARAEAAKTAATTSRSTATTRTTATTPAPVRTKPVAVEPPPPPSGTNPHHNDPFLVCTRTRESSGNYGAVNPGGYYGAYQFSPPTWDLTASHAGEPQLIGVRPDRASPWDQDQIAWVLYQWRGNAPWGGLC